jgi:hypothetical protein
MVPEIAEVVEILQSYRHTPWEDQRTASFGGTSSRPDLHTNYLIERLP